MAKRAGQPALKVLAFNCSLKSAKDKEKSSTESLLRQLMDELEKHGATGAIVRAVDHNIKPGVKSDQGEGDDWPALRQRVINCDILVMATPIWLGQPSSVAKRVMERMDAFLDETDDKDRMPSYGKVGIVVVVGNEDGAHHCAAELIQALTEVGFSSPPGSVTYWVGEAQGDKEYKSLKLTPKVVAKTTAMLASNAAHLARLLKRSNYPGTG
jgi:multimeric flavodoxin WrbA